MKLNKVISKAVLLCLLATNINIQPVFAADNGFDNLEKQFADFIASDGLEKNFNFKGSYEELKDNIDDLIYDAQNTNDINEYNTYFVYWKMVNDGDVTKISLKKYVYNTPEELKYAEDFAKKEAFNIVNKEDTDFIKILKLSDYMATHYYYDPDVITHDVKTMIDKKYGVCTSYALLFYELANAAGIETYCEPGRADNVGHIWNIVKVNGKFYFLDVTNTLSFEMPTVFLDGMKDLDVYEDNELVYDYTLDYEEPEVAVEDYHYDFTSINDDELDYVRTYLEELEKRREIAQASYDENSSAFKILADKYDKSRKVSDYKELINFRNQLVLGSDIRRMVDTWYIMPYYDHWVSEKIEKVDDLAKREEESYEAFATTKLKTLIREIDNLRAAVKTDDINPFRSKNEDYGIYEQIDILYTVTVNDLAELYVTDMKKKKTKASYNTAVAFIKQYKITGYEEVMNKYKKMVK